MKSGVPNMHVLGALKMFIRYFAAAQQ